MLERLLRHHASIGSKGPDNASLLVTGRCNLRCGMCSFWRDSHDGQTLSLPGWKDILRQLRDFGVRNISFQGGEPTLYPGIEELVAEAKDLGFENRQIITNGTRPEVIERLTPHLTKIAVSLDSLDGATHDRIRGVRGIGESVRRLVLALNERLPVAWSYVIQSDNVHELDEVVRFAEAHAIKELYMVFVASATVGHSAHPDTALSSFEKKHLPEVLMRIYARATPLIVPTLYDNMLVLRRFREPFVHRCDVPGNLIAILPTGDMYVCSGDLPPVGNVRVSRVDAIWASVRTRTMLSEAHAGRPGVCQRCQHVRTYFDPVAALFNLTFSSRNYLPYLCPDLRLV
jgi:radical SAM protein with 4Fe4S-binding SPASM domain